MQTFFYIYLFLLGLILGSFFNVVGLRIPKGQSIVKPPSHCPKCNERLRFIDLLPLLSFFIFFGKCRHCKEGISAIYPLIELATAVLFTISPLLVGWSKELLITLALISLLMIIFISDIHYMIIPDRVLIFFLCLLVLLRIFVPFAPWWSPFVGAFVGFLIMYTLAIVSKGGMGGGDIKLFFVLGLALGFQATLLAIFLSAFYGSLFGIIGMMLQKVERGKPIPFGPFIVMGSLTAYFFGEKLFSLYWQLLL